MGRSGAGAFIWTPSQPNGTTGTYANLKTLLPPNSGWTLKEATAISDIGQIVGIGSNAAGENRAFLMSPNGTVPTACSTETQKVCPVSNGVQGRLTRTNANTAGMSFTLMVATPSGATTDGPTVYVQTTFGMETFRPQCATATVAGCWA